MSYSVIYSSPTGNTELLARAIYEVLPQEECVYFGEPNAQALSANTLYVGFWTDKGSCDEKIAHFLQSLTCQRLFLFGTAGFGGTPAYFEQILSRVEENLNSNIPIIGTYMCQGKMPPAVRTRYQAMEDSPQRTAMLENFDRALAHPDKQDLIQLQNIVKNNG